MATNDLIYSIKAESQEFDKTVNGFEKKINNVKTDKLKKNLADSTKGLEDGFNKIGEKFGGLKDIFGNMATGNIGGAARGAAAMLGGMFAGTFSGSLTGGLLGGSQTVKNAMKSVFSGLSFEKMVNPSQWKTSAKIFGYTLKHEFEKIEGYLKNGLISTNTAHQMKNHMIHNLKFLGKGVQHYLGTNLKTMLTTSVDGIPQIKKILASKLMSVGNVFYDSFMKIGSIIRTSGLQLMMPIRALDNLFNNFGTKTALMIKSSFFKIVGGIGAGGKKMGQSIAKVFGDAMILTKSVGGRLANVLLAVKTPLSAAVVAVAAAFAAAGGILKKALDTWDVVEVAQVKLQVLLKAIGEDISKFDSKIRGTKMDALSNLAQTMSRAFNIPQPDAFEGFANLAKEGFSVEKIISVAPVVANMKNIGGVSFAEAAEDLGKMFQGDLTRVAKKYQLRFAPSGDDIKDITTAFELLKAKSEGLSEGMAMQDSFATTKSAWSEMLTSVGEMYDTNLKTHMLDFSDWIGGEIKRIGEWFKLDSTQKYFENVFMILFSSIKALWGFIKITYRLITAFFGSIFDSIRFVGTLGSSIFKIAWGGIVSIKDLVVGMFQMGVQLFNSFVSMVSENIKGITNIVTGTADAIWTQIASYFTTFWGMLSATGNLIWTGLTSGTGAIVASIKATVFEAIAGFLEEIKSSYPKLFSWLGGESVLGAVSGMAEKARGSADERGGAVSDAYSQFKDSISKFSDAATNGFANTGAKIAEVWGENALNMGVAGSNFMSQFNIQPIENMIKNIGDNFGGVDFGGKYLASMGGRWMDFGRTVGDVFGNTPQKEIRDQRDAAQRDLAGAHQKAQMGVGSKPYEERAAKAAEKAAADRQKELETITELSKARAQEVAENRKADEERRRELKAAGRRTIVLAPQSPMHAFSRAGR